MSNSESNGTCPSRFAGRLGKAAMLLCILCVGTQVVRAVVEGMGDYWNGARLAPAISLSRGYRLYYGPDSGPVSNHIYPVLGPLLYYPTSWLSSPGPAIAIGLVFSLLCFYLPIMWIINHSSQTGTNMVGALSRLHVIMLFVILSLSLAPLRCAAAVHADAPALGLAALACGCLLRRRESSCWKNHFGAALFAVFSVWTKQVMAPLLLVLLLWEWFAKGFRSFICLTGMLLVVGVLVSVSFVLFLDPKELLFNIWTIPSRHAWIGSFPDNVLRHGHELLMISWPLLLILAFFLCLPGTEEEPALSRSRLHPWGLFFLVAVLLTPTSILARVKVGGSENAFGPSLYFLTLAACLVLCRLMHDHRPAVPAESTRLLVNLFLAGFCLLHLPHEAALLCRLHRERPYPQDIAYRYLREHPGEVYFPQFPLAHLMAEGKLYHFEYGVMDRFRAGFPVLPDHFQAHVPPDAQYVCFAPNTDWPAEMVELLKDYSRTESIRNLTGWICHAREP